MEIQAEIEQTVDRMGAHNIDMAVRKLFGEIHLLKLNESLGATIIELLAIVPESETPLKVDSKTEKTDGPGEPISRHVYNHQNNKASIPEVQRILFGEKKESPDVTLCDPYDSIKKVKLSYRDPSAN